MSSTPTSSPHSSEFSKKLVHGFTLVELIMAMGLVAILAAITLGIMGGVQDSQKRTQAKAEMAVIAQSLESFKNLYGDYPYIEETSDLANANELLVALTGWSRLEQQGSSPPEMAELDTQRAPLVDMDTLNLPQYVEIPVDAPPGTDAYLVDPWDNPYVYIYNVEGGAWENFGFILFSAGPDGLISLSGVEDDGIVDQDWRDLASNLDNVYLED